MLGSAVGLVADSDTITIVLESFTQNIQDQSPTLPVTVSPGKDKYTKMFSNPSWEGSC